MQRTFDIPVLACFAAGLLGIAIAETVIGSLVWWVGALCAAAAMMLVAMRTHRGLSIACGCMCAALFGARAASVQAPVFPPSCEGPKAYVPGASAGEAGLKIGTESEADSESKSDPDPDSESKSYSDSEPESKSYSEAESGVTRARPGPNRRAQRRFRGIVDGPIGRERGPTGEMRLRVALRLRQEACGDAWIRCDARLSVSLRAMQAPLGIGDEIEVAFEPKPLPPRRTFAHVAPEERARRQQIIATARSDTYALVTPSIGVTASLERWRQRTAQRFERALPTQTQALAKALATGDQLDIAPLTRQAWADAGTAHLLSVSGLHVALVAWLVHTLARATVQRMPHVIERWGRTRATVALTVPGIVAYGLVTGGSSAAWRATLMACALLIARTMRRNLRASEALGGAGLALLMVAPMAVYDPGFWLSFIAVGALLVLPKPRAAAGAWERARASLSMGVMMSLAASAATAPLTAWYFGRVSVMGPLTNLIAAPVGSWVATPLALALALFGPISQALTRLLAWPLHHVLRGLDLLSIYAAKLPFAAFDVSLPHVNLAKAAVFWKTSSLLIIQHIYVGHGDATLIRMPQGQTMLVDGGGAVGYGGDPAIWAVIPSLREAGVGSIDVMVATHPHPDHINGLVEVARRYTVKEFWYNGTGASLPVMARLLDTLRANGTQIRTSASLPGRTTFGDVRIDRLHPSPPIQGLHSANDNSLVLRIQYGARSILLTGDIEAWAEEQITKVLEPVDIMKVPHHGSRTSSSSLLLSAARPQLAVASCGIDNRWGFPHAEVKERYQAAGIVLWRTDTHGEIVAETDGVRWTVTSAGSSEKIDLSQLRTQRVAQ